MDLIGSRKHKNVSTLYLRCTVSHLPEGILRDCKSNAG